MKKAYLIIVIVLAGIAGTYTLLACNNTRNAQLPADEQPVDLTAVPAGDEHGGPITVAEFDKLIGGDKLTMVDFYTTWCGPCKMMAPHVVRLKETNSDVVNVLQIDAEEQLELATRYNVNAYPTIMFFKKGQVVNTTLGARTYDQLLAFVEKFK